jgi:hypothetical protein
MPEIFRRRREEGRLRDEAMQSAKCQETNPFKPRASRFPIHTLLHFRAKGEAQWKEGETVNISRSGVLFRAPQVMSVRTPLEMIFELPVELAEGPAATVRCQGVVARTVLPAASDDAPVLAATISGYRLEHRPSEQPA